MGCRVVTSSSRARPTANPYTQSTHLLHTPPASPHPNSDPAPTAAAWTATCANTHLQLHVPTRRGNVVEFNLDSPGARAGRVCACPVGRISNVGAHAQPVSIAVSSAAFKGRAGQHGSPWRGPE